MECFDVSLELGNFLLAQFAGPFLLDVYFWGLLAVLYTVYHVKCLLSDVVVTGHSGHLCDSWALPVISLSLPCLNFKTARYESQVTEIGLKYGENINYSTFLYLYIHI